jgi:Tol biopolymer transport system component
MGEVYKARDTRLERVVAIKVLPQHLSSSPEVRQRFEREAKTISQLSHPNICNLYDVNREGETEYLVMEYLEGETLALRLAGGPLPLEQALRFAIQIGEALGVAHGKGIVHRDLKPDNVMLTKSGLKLLDFGLAKPSALAPTSELTSSPTIAAASGNVTREGTILGTLLYMAPEQLEGREADPRTDIFAFGAVLYEMVTGRKAFSGSSQASVISAIMREQPESIGALQPVAPPALERVVRTCLAKDPEERWQSARDVASQLRWIEEGGSQTGIVLSPAPVRRRGQRVAWAVAVLAVAVAAALSAVLLSRRPEAAPCIRTSILPAEKTSFALDEGSLMALSPDGARLVFAASSIEDPAKFLLWIRPLKSTSPRALPGTEGALYPIWSPDSSTLAFMADKRLKEVDLSSGAVRTLCDFSAQMAVSDWISKGGTWSREGVIVFAPDPRDSLYRVSASGGTPVRLTELDRAAGEFSHRYPWFLPDGRHFLYLALAVPKEGEKEPNGIYVGSLDSKERRLIRRTDSVNTALFTVSGGGYMLFETKRGLMVQRFDPKNFALSGEPVILEGRDELYSVSTTGSLALLRPLTPTSQLVWLDREGRRLATLGKPASYWDVRLSHDGRRIAAVLADDQSASYDIWITDISRDVTTRLTSGPDPNMAPVWSPDDTRVAYEQLHGARTDLRVRNVSGAGNEEILFSKESEFIVPGDWSPDGRFVSLITYGKGLWVLSVAEKSAVPLVSSAGFSGDSPSYSPDGRYLAYSSDEGGRSEVYVRAMAGPEDKWQVSTAGGSHPLWSRDGREIVYDTPDGMVMSAGVRTAPQVELTAPRPLFNGKDIDGPYGLSPDGNRLLAGVKSRDARESPITLVQNWTAEIKK